MKQLYFLGQASNFTSPAAVANHLLASGRKHDFDDLKTYLANHYDTTADHVYLMKNGRSALAAALRALVPKDSEVAINAFTCYAVVQAVKAGQCRPVYADIDPATLNYNSKTLKTLIDTHPNLKAIILQNTLALSPDIAKIRRLAEKHGLIIIEDMAHNAGAFYDDPELKEPVEMGRLGDAACFSFGKGKSLDTTTGGALIIRHPEKIRKAPVAPAKTPTFAENYRARFYPLIGQIGRATFNLHLNKFWYAAHIKTHLITRAVDETLDLKKRPANWQCRLALDQFRAMKPTGTTPLRVHTFVDDRAATLKELVAAGYHFEEVWYDVPVSPVRYYKSLNFPESAYPCATAAARHIINLPTYYPKASLEKAISIIESHEISVDQVLAEAKKGANR